LRSRGRADGLAGARGALEWPAFLLYLGSIAWVIHYDTIYAHQDARTTRWPVEIDGALFGQNTRPMLALFSTAAVLLIGAPDMLPHRALCSRLGLRVRGASRLAGRADSTSRS